MVNTELSLYPHQQKAVDFLAATTRGGLFDEQGLGKTISGIVACDRIGAKKVLVIAPVVVALNWAREFSKWSPDRRVQVIRTGRDVVDASASVVVVTHALLLADRVFGQLTERPGRWDVAIVDEAHMFKNPKAKRTRRLYSFGPQLNLPSIASVSRRMWVMTGTPMPNDPTELWTMLRGLAPERILAGKRPLNWHEFRRRYCVLRPVPFGDGWKVEAAQNVPELKERMRGFSIRRLKKDVLDLPPLRWGRVSLQVDELPLQLREIEEELGGLQGEALLEALREKVEFSTWRRLCGIAKAPAAAELLRDELTGSTHKLVVFCHHKEVVEILAEQLDDFGVVRVTGDTNAVERQAAVDEFQRGTARVAICQLVAGGVGITLTAAQDVVFVEQSFVPGENAQAADRCHRIGQTGSVLARVLSLAGSVDELVGEILARKAAMIREVLK